METTTVSNRMLSLIVLYDMHTNYFARVIEDIKDDDAHNRLETKANHVAWLTGSLVHERYEIGKELGIEEKQNTGELFHDYRGIKSGTRYPSLAEYKSDWEKISPLLRNALVNVTDERLDQPFEMPGETMSFYDLLSFMTYREANCIGQIALWRRLLGYEAMNYM